MAPLRRMILFYKASSSKAFYKGFNYYPSTTRVPLRRTCSLNVFSWLFLLNGPATGLFCPHSKFAEENIERAQCKISNPCRTPVIQSPSLFRNGDAYLSYAVQQVCLYMHDPRDPHFTALKRILRYVRGTLDYGLQLHVSYTTQLTAYTDSIGWVTLSRSSVEAEYRGVANVVAETAWIRNLLCELHTPLFTATLVYCDNVSAVYMSANPVQKLNAPNTLRIDIHFCS
ncbi:ribonuclease H-like domain-containing protein [Tanacetum coccineum]